MNRVDRQLDFIKHALESLPSEIVWRPRKPPDLSEAVSCSDVRRCLLRATGLALHRDKSRVHEHNCALHKTQLQTGRFQGRARKAPKRRNRGLTEHDASARHLKSQCEQTKERCERWPVVTSAKSCNSGASVRTL